MLKTVGIICLIIAIFVALYLHDKLDKQIEEEVKENHNLIDKAFKHNYDIQKVSDVIDESWYKFDEYKEFLDLIKEPYQVVKYYISRDCFEYYENDWAEAITVNLGRGEIIEEAYKRWVEKKIVEEALKKEEAVKNLLDKAYDTPENHEVIVDEEIRQKLPVKLYKDDSGNYYSVVETDAIPSDWIFVRRFADKIDAAAYAKRQPDFRYKPYLEFVEELKNNPSDDLEDVAKWQAEGKKVFMRPIHPGVSNREMGKDSWAEFNNKDIADNPDICWEFDYEERINKRGY